MTETLSARVRALGQELPEASTPAANYVPYVVTPPLVVMAGQISQWNGERRHVGKLGAGISLEEGVKAAELCALNLIAQLVRVVDDDLSRIVRCVRLGGFVNATPEFVDHPKVVNGASDLMVKVFGDLGRHARTAVGVSGLPWGVAVEVDAIFEIR